MTLAQADRSLGLIKADSKVAKALAKEADVVANAVAEFLDNDFQASDVSHTSKIKKTFDDDDGAGFVAEVECEIEVDADIVAQGRDLESSAKQFAKSHKVRESDLNDALTDIGESFSNTGASLAPTASVESISDVKVGSVNDDSVVFVVKATIEVSPQN